MSEGKEPIKVFFFGLVSSAAAAGGTASEGTVRRPWCLGRASVDEARASDGPER